MLEVSILDMNEKLIVKH